MGAKHSKAVIPLNGDINKYDITSESLLRAAFFYIVSNAKKVNIYLPTEIIILCINKIGFIIKSEILTEKEKNDLFEFVKTQIITENNNYRYFQVLYCHKMNNKDKLHYNQIKLAKSIKNKHNVLFVIQTLFNHVFIIFIDRIYETVEGLDKKVKMFTYLLRSQFESHPSPKQFFFRTRCEFFDCHIRSDTGRHRFSFANAISCWDNTCLFTPFHLGCDGNELVGGTTFVSRDIRFTMEFNIKQIEIYQIK